MLGVVATPVDSAYDDSWVIFLPNRYARRIGSNRMYTQWARLWATAGVASLRIDVNGTGDAGGPEGETDRDMYRANAVDDVLRAAAFLRENYGARRFAVMGLCSGGYIGFHAALTDSSIEQVILLNPQMLLWTDQETSVTRAEDHPPRRAEAVDLAEGVCESRRAAEGDSPGRGRDGEIRPSLAVQSSSRAGSGRGRRPVHTRLDHRFARSARGSRLSRSLRLLGAGSRDALPGAASR